MDFQGWQLNINLARAAGTHPQVGHKLFCTPGLPHCVFNLVQTLLTGAVKSINPTSMVENLGCF